MKWLVWVLALEIGASAADLKYSNYIPGSAIGVDSAGFVYMAGATASTTFPTTPGALQPVAGGGICFVYSDPHAPPPRPCDDLVLVKWKPGASAPEYSTYVGGDNMEYLGAFAVDGASHAYVAGYTSSSNFPFTQPCSPGTSRTNFVAKLNPDGKSFAWSVCSPVLTKAMTLDSQGNAYVGGDGAVVAKLSADTGAVLWSIQFGNANLTGLAVDASGAVFATGGTRDPAFPTTPGVVQPVFAGPADNVFGLGDAFVTKIKPSGDGIAFSTYLGGSGHDRGNAIGVDASGSVWVAGTTTSVDFPITTDALQPRYTSSAKGPFDWLGNAFLAKLNSTGTTLLYATFLGGTGGEEAQALSIDATGSVYVAGYTVSQDFPLVTAVQALCRDSNCGFVSKIGPKGLVYSTYIGGQSVTGLVPDPSGDMWLVGVAGELQNQVQTGGPPPLPLWYGGYLARIGSQPPPRPRIWGVRDGAAYSQPCVAPGEVIAVYGEGLGPEQPISATVDRNAIVTTSGGGVTVFVDGAPVPLLHAGQNSATAVMPFGVSTGGYHRVEVEYHDLRSSPVQVCVVDTAVVALTTGPWWSYQTPRAVLNQDGSLNSFLHPASPGSVITLYLTGAGAMSPPPRDGELLMGASAVPIAPLNVTIGPSPAQVLYAGNAPGQVAGVVQVNVGCSTGSCELTACLRGYWLYVRGINHGPVAR